MEREAIVQCVRRWGGVASGAILDPACSFFTLPDREGVIGYRMQNHAMVAFGDPVCAPVDLPYLVTAFHDFCRHQRKSVVYLIASDSFASWAMQNGCRAAMAFGEEFFLNSDSDLPQEGAHGRLVRRKLRHAQKEGVTIEEYRGNDGTLEQAMEEVGQQWLQARHGPQLFISHINLFQDRFGKRWFYAQCGERIVGVLQLLQLQSRKGWLMNRLMVTADAPHGTPESLVIAAIDALHAEKCPYISLGMSAGKKLQDIQGLNFVNASIAKCIYTTVKMLFPIGGTMKFWEKFHPERAPSYLIFGHFGLREIRSLISVLR